LNKLLKSFALALGVAVALSMAEVERARIKTVAAGIEPVVLEPINIADTQLIPNTDGRTLIRVIAPAEAVKVTVVTPNVVGGNPIADLENEVGISKVEMMGPFDPSVYNNAKGQLEVKVNKAGIKLEVYNVEF
jgi:hypothetical protein